MWRIIDLGGDGYTLHIKNSNIIVKNKDGAETKIAIADVHSILAHGYNTMFSQEFLSLCMENEIPIIFCNEKHEPNGMLFPFFLREECAVRLEKQFTAKLPRKKQVWKKIIVAKIRAQSKVLQFKGKYRAASELSIMADRVLSGDSSNYEGQAARIYFRELFDDDFNRRDDDDGLNGILNYGYSIVRSCVARGVVSCGLHPGLSVFHSNRINPFALIDDLMEPIRPFVDNIAYDVKEATGSNDLQLTPEIKRKLIAVSNCEVLLDANLTEMTTGIRIYVMDYYKYICGEQDMLRIPELIN